MTNSTIPQDWPKSNRVDSAHDLLRSQDDADAQEANRWLAFAGRDPEFTSDQVNRQAGELLAYVQDQNREIDDRQAELNAKLAQLDNQLRNARLRGLDDQAGADLLSGATDLPSATLTPTPTEKPIEEPRHAQEMEFGKLGFAQEEVSRRLSQPTSPARGAEMQEFDEVDQLVAEFNDLGFPKNALLSENAVADLWNHDPDTTPIDDAPLIETPQTPPHHTEPKDEIVLSEEAIVEESVSPRDDAQVEGFVSEDRETVAFDTFPQLLAESHLNRIDTLETPSLEQGAAERDALASERRQLAERKAELDRQMTLVRRIETEANSLHREALEMRIVTEQLWGKLSDTIPADQLKALLAKMRTQLDAHYTKEKSSVEQHKQELAAMQGQLADQQQELREQSSKMQAWFASREEQLRGYANEVDARVTLLDRREQRLQDEFAKWQAERKDYESRLRGLSQKLAF